MKQKLDCLVRPEILLILLKVNVIVVRYLRITTVCYYISITERFEWVNGGWVMDYVSKIKSGHFSKWPKVKWDIPPMDRPESKILLEPDL